MLVRQVCNLNREFYLYRYGVGKNVYFFNCEFQNIVNMVLIRSNVLVFLYMVDLYCDYRNFLVFLYTFLVDYFFFICVRVVFVCFVVVIFYVFFYYLFLISFNI